MRYGTTFVGLLITARRGCVRRRARSTPTTPTPPTTTHAADDESTGADDDDHHHRRRGVSPQRITVSPGTRVTFVNNDSRQHEMNSDPHPTHGDCPPIDDVGFLAPGQSKQTGNLNTVRTCGYHDHNQPDTANLKGQIVIQ